MAIKVDLREANSCQNGWIFRKFYPKTNSVFYHKKISDLAKKIEGIHWEKVFFLMASFRSVVKIQNRFVDLTTNNPWLWSVNFIHIYSIIKENILKVSKSRSKYQQKWLDHRKPLDIFNPSKSHIVNAKVWYISFR